MEKSSPDGGLPVLDVSIPKEKKVQKPLVLQLAKEKC